MKRLCSGGVFYLNKNKLIKYPITFDYVFSTPVGNVGLKTGKRGIRVLSYTLARRTSKKPNDDLVAEVYRQLMEYFDAHRTRFELPLDAEGTAYQKSVWRQLAKIPYGKSLTYGGVATKLKSGPRAVGNACRDNPISIIIPCHRVLSKSGLGGYSGCVAGDPVARKQWLLQHEGIM